MREGWLRLQTHSLADFTKTHGTTPDSSRFPHEDAEDGRGPGGQGDARALLDGSVAPVTVGFSDGEQQCGGIINQSRGQ